MVVARKPVRLPVVDHVLPVGGAWKNGVPSTRGECVWIERGPDQPCPFIKCRHHTWLIDSSDMPGRRMEGRAKPESKKKAPPSKFSCTLDFVGAAEVTPGITNAAVVADELGLTRRRIEQITKRALQKLKAAGVDLRIVTGRRK